MKRQGAGRVLTFAVTGALLGGGAVAGGCGPKKGGPYTNTGPMDDVHVNPGPDEDPGAADGAAPEPDHVNEGPVEEPPADAGKPPVEDVNPGPQAEPAPEPDHVNVRKVADEPRDQAPPVKYVNTVRQPDPPPAPKQ